MSATKVDLGALTQQANKMASDAGMSLDAFLQALVALEYLRQRQRAS